MTEDQIEFSQEALDAVFSPQRIRYQANRIHEHCRHGQGHFELREELLPSLLEYVNDVIEKRHPDGIIPYHSRFGHFQVGGVDRLARLNTSLAGLEVIERVRAKIDLSMVSVLLDAGAGPQWQYIEAETGKVVSRSEGLAVASLNMFVNGLFSSDQQIKCQADGGGLLHLTRETLETGFQVCVGNPLVGVEGRLNLLHALGRVVEENKEIFGGFYSRPGHLVDYLLRKYPSKEVPSADLLNLLLLSLAPIWPKRIQLGNINLGDVWYHSALGDKGSWESLQPFHKLTQWLLYSLLSPLEEAGIKILDLNALTGLPEYRNGGLLIDRGLLTLKNPEDQFKIHRPDSFLIVEWRALTVYYIDEIYRGLCRLRGLSAEEFPLVKVLEGGTWWAGRKAAKEKRVDGTPPLSLTSDGTVF